MAVLHWRGEPDSSASQVERRSRQNAVLARFEEIALPHLEAVYRLARALALDEAEAEDLVQETFLRAFQAFEAFELREYGARPWLFRILHNAFFTLKGKQKRSSASWDRAELERLAVPGDPDRAPIGLSELNWESFDEEIKSAVVKLPPEYRTVLLLWSIEGCTYKEIATICECALGTVMSRLYRARRLMANQLGNYARQRNWPRERLD